MDSEYVANFHKFNTLLHTSICRLFSGYELKAWEVISKKTFKHFCKPSLWVVLWCFYIEFLNKCLFKFCAKGYYLKARYMDNFGLKNLVYIIKNLTNKLTNYLVGWLVSQITRKLTNLQSFLSIFFPSTSSSQLPSSSSSSS